MVDFGLEFKKAIKKVKEQIKEETQITHKDFGLEEYEQPIATKFDFNIDDFLVEKVNAINLYNEIKASNIYSNLEHITCSNGICSICFEANVSKEDEQILDEIISKHIG